MPDVKVDIIIKEADGEEEEVIVTIPEHHHHHPARRVQFTLGIPSPIHKE